MKKLTALQLHKEHKEHQEHQTIKEKTHLALFIFIPKYPDHQNPREGRDLPGYDREVQKTINRSLLHLFNPTKSTRYFA